MSDRNSFLLYTMAIFAMCIAALEPSNVPGLLFALSVLFLGVALITGNQLWKKLQ